MVVRHRLLLLLLCIGAVFLTPAVCDFNEERVAELVQRQADAPDRVIDLDDNSLKRFASADQPRSYSLVIFFDAKQLRSNSELHLEELRREFALLASSYFTNNEDKDAATKVFFCQLEFQKSQASFALFGVNALPHIRLLPPGSADPKDSESIGMTDFFRSAEGMATFVESKTKQIVGPIARPPLVTNKQLQFLAGGLAVAAPFVIKKITAQNTPLHNPHLWCIGALVIYFFSVSGGMHNIIRKMPLFMADRNNPGKLVFFYQGSGMQLGAEGFAVGFLYTIVGLMIAFMTHIVIKVQSKPAQRFLMLLGMAVSYLAVRKVIILDNWKTGYAIHSYWPKKWT
ncbi:hypothetical protein O6H91_20G002700 [Diphasiastrum complanatum]|nr:hypothetical protein O6H91_20G002700 [Diphasiastrum complanatum]